jgi:hypothetical protein
LSELPDTNTKTEMARDASPLPHPLFDDGGPRLTIAAPSQPSTARKQMIRATAVTLGTAGVLLFLGVRLNRGYAIKDWLLPTVAVIWGWQLVLAASCLCFGDWLLDRVLKIACPSRAERVALAVPLGAISFGLGVFVAGLFRLLHPAFAVVWPALMLTVGVAGRRRQPGEPVLSLAWLRGLAVVRAPATNVISIVAAGFGVVALGLLYLGSFSPDAVGYDAAWYHLVIAQDYAREGRIVSYMGDWAKNLPQLGSFINTWSFLVPGLAQPAQKWMMALHTEFAFFVWTLVGVGATVGRLTGRPGWMPGAWAAMFLFPALFAADHNLSGAADHFLAFFAVPILLALFGTLETMQARWWALIAILTAGAVMTKYQASQLAWPTAAILVVGLASAARRALANAEPGPLRLRLRRLLPLLSGPALAAGLVAVLTAPLFVRHLVSHHNPLFPFGQDVFRASTPTIPGASDLANTMLRHWSMHPPHEVRKLFDVWLEAFMTFPYHVGQTPESGAILAVAAVATPFLPRARGLWLAFALLALAIATWAMTYVQSRNLEGLLPLAAAVTAAALVRAWRLGSVARVGVAIAVLLQIGAGADGYFEGAGRVQSAMSLIRSGREGRANNRFDQYRHAWVQVSRALPKDAFVLVHDAHVSLGIDRPLVLDALGFESLIDHRTFRTAADLYRRLKQLKITHVVYGFDFPAQTLQNEAVFAAFAWMFRDHVTTYDHLRVLTLPDQPPPDELPYDALVLGIDGWADGLYAVGDLGAWDDLPPWLRVPHAAPLAPASADALPAGVLARARVVLLGNKVALPAATREEVNHQFNTLVAYPDRSVLVR